MSNYEIKPNVSQAIVGSNGMTFTSIRKLAKHIHKNRDRIAEMLKLDGFYKHNGVVYTFKTADPNGSVTDAEQVQQPTVDQEEFENFKKFKDVESLPFERYEFK